MNFGCQGQTRTRPALAGARDGAGHGLEPKPWPRHRLPVRTSLTFTLTGRFETQRGVPQSIPDDVGTPRLTQPVPTAESRNLQRHPHPSPASTSRWLMVMPRPRIPLTRAACEG